MTETQQRFLRAIAERVPSAQVVEVHLFPPMRQGGVETGVAVVAEDPRRPSPNVMESLPAAPGPAGEMDQADGAVEDQTGGAAAGEAVVGKATTTEESAAESWVGELADAIEDASADALLAAESESPYLEETAVEAEAIDQADGAGEEEGEAAPAAAAPRYTIHTARYRLTLKGADRGKWDFDVVAEADASLEALDKVVRGVQRRSGEGAEPDRLTTDAFREALDAPLAVLER